METKDKVEDLVEIILTSFDDSVILDRDHPVTMLCLRLFYGQEVEEFIKASYRAESPPLPYYDGNTFLIKLMSKFKPGESNFYCAGDYCSFKLPLHKILQLRNVVYPKDKDVFLDDNDWYVKELVGYSPENVLAEGKIPMSLLPEDTLKLLKAYRTTKD